MFYSIFTFIIIPFLVNVVSNLVSGWLSRKMYDKSDNKK